MDLTEKVLVDECTPLLTCIRARWSGFYEPDPKGKLAMLLPVESHAGKIIDIVAWPFDDPDHWFLRTGRGRILGARNLDQARLLSTMRLSEDSPPGLHMSVVAYPTPADWLSDPAKGRFHFSICNLHPGWKLPASWLEGIKLIPYKPPKRERAAA